MTTAAALLPIRLDGRARSADRPAPAESRRAGRGSVIRVRRPETRWQWRTVIADSITLVAVVWSIPLIILLVGTPLALAVLAVVWTAGRVLSLF